MKNTKQYFNQSVYISDDKITEEIWTAYFVHWCYLLHCGNVILPKAEITPETLVFPDGL